MNPRFWLAVHHNNNREAALADPETPAPVALLALDEGAKVLEAIQKIQPEVSELLAEHKRARKSDEHRSPTRQMQAALKTLVDQDPFAPKSLQQLLHEPITIASAAKLANGLLTYLELSPNLTYYHILHQAIQHPNLPLDKLQELHATNLPSRLRTLALMAIRKRTRG